MNEWDECCASEREDDKTLSSDWRLLLKLTLTILLSVMSHLLGSTGTMEGGVKTPSSTYRRPFFASTAASNTTASSNKIWPWDRNMFTLSRIRTIFFPYCTTNCKLTFFLSECLCVLWFIIFVWELIQSCRRLKTADLIWFNVFHHNRKWYKLLHKYVPLTCGYYIYNTCYLLVVVMYTHTFVLYRNLWKIYFSLHIYTFPWVLDLYVCTFVISVCLYVNLYHEQYG